MNHVQIWNPFDPVPFPDQTFDLIFSDQVLEHVQNLDTVANEMARILKPGGEIVNIWPSYKRIVEPHLFMPFVHWLPKNWLRKLWIRMMLTVGKDPQWAQLKDKNHAEKATVYYDYSVQKTYYRSPTQIYSIFYKQGLKASFHGKGAPENRLLRKVINRLGLNNWYGLTFGSSWMHAAFVTTA